MNKEITNGETAEPAEDPYRKLARQFFGDHAPSPRYPNYPYKGPFVKLTDGNAVRRLDQEAQIWKVEPKITEPMIKVEVDTVAVGRCVLCYAIIFQDDILTMEPPSDLPEFIRVLASSSDIMRRSASISQFSVGNSSNEQFENAIRQLSAESLRCLCRICSGVCEQVLSKLGTSSELTEEANELKQRCIAAVQLSSVMFEKKKSSRYSEGDNDNLKIVVWVDIVRQYVLERRTISPGETVETLEGLNWNTIKTETKCEFVVVEPDLNWNAIVANEAEIPVPWIDIKEDYNEPVDLIGSSSELNSNQNNSRTYRPLLREAPKKLGGGKKRYECDICGANARDRVALNHHKLMKHAEIRTFKCEYCSKNFQLEYQLSYHITQHIEQELPYVCHHCQEKFSSKLLLKDHLQEHHFESHASKQTSARPYSCSLCTGTFITKGFLSYHMMRAHSVSISSLPTSSSCQPPKLETCSFKCDICEAQFPLEKNLSAHFQEKHLGVEPKAYKCPKCGRSYKKKFDLDKHLVHHAGKMLACPFCNQCFLKRDPLNKHVKKNHLGFEDNNILLANQPT